MSNSLLAYQEEEWESVKRAVAEEFLEEWKFFAPSLELARAILQLNHQLGDEYFGREYEELAASEFDVRYSEEPIKDGNWFRWLFQHVSGILSHHTEETADLRLQSEEEAVSFFQTFISERVFNHLAMLSRSRHARKGKPFSIREELTNEIAEKLGLGLALHQKTSHNLRVRVDTALLQLAREFQHWLVDNRGGMHRTTWGIICGAGKDMILDKDIIMEGNDASLILLLDVEAAEACAAAK